MKLPFPVTRLTPVGGGDLNDAFRAELEDGRVVFIKTSAAAPAGGFAAPAAPAGGFAAEAAGLAWIAAVEGAPPVPRVLAVGDDFLALEWIEVGGALDAERFGRALAALHQSGAPSFGALAPGVTGGVRIGPLALATGTAGPTSPGQSPVTWADLHAAHLLGLARSASAAGSLSAVGLAAVERVCARLDELGGPAEPPARLHGDLWSGNALAGADGRGYLIDPAAYGGHREVDLAMMALFGGFSERCFAAYAEAYPLSEGWPDRVELYQLLPLLIHAVLFGGGYGARATAIARRYAG